MLKLFNRKKESTNDARDFHRRYGRDWLGRIRHRFVGWSLALAALTASGFVLSLTWPAAVLQATQQGAYPQSGGAFSNITPGTNTNAGLFAFSQTGVFTNSQFNLGTLTSTLTGGGSCNANNIVNLGGTAFNLTDAISACVNIPTSGVTNGFTNGYGSYLVNPNANATGQFGWVGAVGYYSQVWCTGGSAANTRCWGANFSVSDNTSAPATLLGNEYDVTVNNTTTTGAGTTYSFRGAGQPTANNFPALRIDPPASTGQFTDGLKCRDGSLATGATLPAACLDVGQQVAGSSQDSGFAWFNASQGASAINIGFHFLQDGFAIWGTTGGTAPVVVDTDSSNAGAGRASGYGTTLKATAGLTVNQLVKVDTANTDSVVVCTTTDTHCTGFVAGGAVYCAAGGAHCGLITAPGSKAVGILGTGTCSIGNFVIVDTTTNGRVKCVTSIPAQGAYIGDAISAQASVGSTLDILTRFQ